MRILGISLAILNFVLWWSVPAIRAFVDAQTGRWANAENPKIVTGVQELLVYFDPWLARGAFPIVFTVGLAVIPFLRIGDRSRANVRPSWVYPLIISILLIGFEFVWLFLISVAVYLRGPNWSLFWPGEPWDEHKIVIVNNLNLSQYFWLSIGDPMMDMPWVKRELPGLILLGCYFLGGIGLAYAFYRADNRQTPVWRWGIMVLIVQLAALVPLKMISRWIFNLKYWIQISESSWNV